MKFTCALTLVPAFLLWGCTDTRSPATDPAGPVVSHKPGHGGGTPSTEDTVATFRDAATDGMLSDGTGAHTSVAIGDFFALDAKAGTGRQLCFSYHGQLSPSQVGFSDQPTAEVLCDNANLTTSVNNYQEDNVTPGVPFVDMPNGSVQRARFGGVYVREGYNWSFKYGRDCDNIDLPAERSTITRVSTTEWTIEATAMTMCKTAVRGRTTNPFVASGLNMPLRITVSIVPLTP